MKVICMTIDISMYKKIKSQNQSIRNLETGYPEYKTQNQL